MPLSRRELLAGASAAGALFVARGSALAKPLGGGEPTTVAARTSRLRSGVRLAHADMHNHSLFSDGAGDPAATFGSMRGAGLDIAALTDHSTVSKDLPQSACPNSDCQSLAGIDEQSWATAKALADTANADGSFAAIRGFEWSSPVLGHMNVWFSQDWTDPLHTGGVLVGEGLAQFAHENVPGAGPEVSGPLDDLVKASPATGAGMRLLYDWFATDPAASVLGGGADGIAGFNHPGREAGRFGYFHYDARVRDRVVSIEAFNRGEDYLFEGTDEGFVSPVAQCLDAGWRVGLLGVTDEHGTNWGFPDGKGRTGLWVKDLSRAGVREAMLARRFFSTRQRGLRIDADANGVQMGGTVPHATGPLRFRLDVDRGSSWWGKELVVQVLATSGDLLPRVLATRLVKVPRDHQPVISFTAKVDAADSPWVVLRVCDPAVAADGRATGDWKAVGSAIAYTSPFFLTPA